MSNDRIGSFDGSSQHKNSGNKEQKGSDQLVETLENRERFRKTQQMINQGKGTFNMVRELCSIFYLSCTTELPDSPGGLKTTAQIPARELAPD